MTAAERKPPVRPRLLLWRALMLRWIASEAKMLCIESSPRSESERHVGS
jgi:hypothetical protein